MGGSLDGATIPETLENSTIEESNTSEEFNRVCGSNNLDLSGGSPINPLKTMNEAEREKTAGDEIRKMAPVTASTPKTTKNDGENTLGAGDKGQEPEGGRAEEEQGGGRRGGG